MPIWILGNDHKNQLNTYETDNHNFINRFCNIVTWARYHQCPAGHHHPKPNIQTINQGDHRAAATNRASQGPGIQRADADCHGLHGRPSKAGRIYQGL